MNTDDNNNEGMEKRLQRILEPILSPPHSLATESPKHSQEFMEVDEDIEHVSYNYNKLVISRLGKDIEIIKHIDQGGFGHVVMAKHKIDKRIYAVKCIPFKKEEHLGIIHKKVKEAEIISGFMHKNLVLYKDSWIDDCPVERIAAENIENLYCGHQLLWLCILMELCTTNLTHIIEKELARQPVRAYNIFWQIVEGLAYLHSKGWIHGDLRPDNVFIRRNKSRDDVKIGDFGNTTWALRDEFALTTAKEDIYSLGVILLEMFLPSLINTARYSSYSRREQMKIAMNNKDEENVCLIRLLRWLLNEDPDARPTCADLLREKENFPKSIVKRKKRQLGQLSNGIAETISAAKTR